MTMLETFPPFSAPTGPRPWQTFADETDRARLTPAALEAIRNVAQAWSVTGIEMAALLERGIISTTPPLFQAFSQM